MKKYTDDQLKHTLAKMLPKLLSYEGDHDQEPELFWKIASNCAWTVRLVLHTELLYVCQLAEEGLTGQEEANYYYALSRDCGVGNYRATWQQRTTALAEIKGISIV